MILFKRLKPNQTKNKQTKRLIYLGGEGEEQSYKSRVKVVLKTPYFSVLCTNGGAGDISTPIPYKHLASLLLNSSRGGVQSPSEGSIPILRHILPTSNLDFFLPHYTDVLLFCPKYKRRTISCHPLYKTCCKLGYCHLIFFSLY